MIQTATATRILDIAQQLVQMRGFNAFSFTDIAKQIGIKDASIHYHFPSKAALGRELVKRYHERFSQQLSQLSDARLSAVHQLERYAQLFQDVVDSDGRVCLCGMLASELLTLPPEVQAEVQSFFRENELWLTGVLGHGRTTGELHFSGGAELQAQVFLSTLEGAMLLTRSHGDPSCFKPIVAQLLSALVKGT